MATSISSTLSGIQDIDALLSGTQWNTGNLTYSFPASASVYPTPDPIVSGYQALIPELEARVRVALATISQYANVTFTEITETNSQHADFRFGMTDLSAVGLEHAAVSFNPGDAFHNIWLQTGDWQVSSFRPDLFVTLGGYGFYVLLHEIGHALGFQHPTGLLEPAHDGFDYSIMDYRIFPGEPPPFELTVNSGEPETLMIADIEALQYMYGANFNTNNTDTVYKWDPNSGQEFINGIGQDIPGIRMLYMTVWDGGGVDTYDFSNFFTNVTADLRPGNFSSPAFLPGDTRNLVPFLGYDLQGNPVFAEGSIANALLYHGDTRSLIENAIGGSGNDILIGNQGNNVLTGNFGDDTFFYTGGIDTFIGGTKGIAALGDTADFSLSSVGVVIKPVATTVTTVTPTGQTITFTISDTSSAADRDGDAYDASLFTEIGLVHLVEMHGIENITGSPFADTITGNFGNNTIKAGNGNDYVFYTGGFDRIDGGNGIDTIDFSSFGFAVSVTLSLFVGVSEAFTTDTSSILTGTSFREIADLAGFDNLVGTAFADSLIGNSGNNTIDGRSGNDFLFYDGGLDVLNGNTGIDTADFSRMASAVFVDLAGGGFEARGNGTANANTGNLTNLADLQSIENLTGTSFADVLHGDNNANNIDGGGGNDILDGGFGNDTLIGGKGIDTASFVSHDTSSVPSGEVNTISLGLNGADGSFVRTELSRSGTTAAESDILRGIENVIGSNRAETINGNELDNKLAGRGGSDIINGGAGNDTYDFTGSTGLSIGNDRLFDQSGTADRILINSLSDITSATRSGNDLVVTLVNGSFRIVDHFNGHQIESLSTLDGHTVTLSTSNIGAGLPGIIAAGNGAETLDGKGGDDLLFGGNGSDRIIGGDGDDQLTGGNGGDTFVFGPGFGHDLVTDFSPADRIEFDDGVFQNFQAVQAAIQQVGTDTVIMLDNDNSITLQNVDLHNLHVSDFFFV